MTHGFEKKEIFQETVLKQSLGLHSLGTPVNPCTTLFKMNG